MSIVTPSFNQAAFLEETLCSVLEQDYPRIEYIVVDGGSSDGSVEIIGRYADRLAWWVSEPDAGQPQAINKGFARSSGALMGFLNSDDTLLPGAVGRLVAALAEDQEALVAYGDARFVDEKGAVIRSGTPRVWDAAEMARCGSGSVLQPSSLWRRAAWELAGPMDDRFQYVFDTIFFLSVAAQAGTAVYVPEPLASYRVHPESKSARMSEVPHAEECIRLADEVFGGLALPALLRPHARAARAAYYRRAALGLYNAGEVSRARATFLRSLLLRPLMSARTARYMAPTLLPGAVVHARRRRRAQMRMR